MKRNSRRIQILVLSLLAAFLWAAAPAARAQSEATKSGQQKEEQKHHQAFPAQPATPPRRERIPASFGAVIPRDRPTLFDD